jgi:hypothetical protein
MSDNTKFTVTAILFLAFVFTMGYLIGMSNGFLDGYTKSSEDSKRITCEMDYSYKAYNEIPGHCIKYFIKK